METQGTSAVLVRLFVLPVMCMCAGFFFPAITRAGPAAASQLGPHARVHVRGAARLDLHATRSSGKVVVAGTVSDDASRPLGRVPVALLLSRSGTTVTFASIYEPCSDEAARPVLERADVLVLTADDAGYFCTRLTLGGTSDHGPADRYLAHVEARTGQVADGLIDDASADLPIDLSHDSITLRFDPERSLLSLDEPSTVIQVIASSDADGSPRGASGLPIVLANEAGVTLGTATTDGAGHARFVLASESVGAPGPGELRAFFSGSTQAAAASRTMRVERRLQVELSAPDAVDGRLPAGSPEDGIAIRLAVRARCPACAHGAAPSGMVEARLEDGDAIVGAAPLRGAGARMIATFTRAPASTSGQAAPTLRLRYIPDAPWFVPGPELRVEQPTRDPGVWTRLPLLLAAALMVAWLVLARIPSAGTAPRQGQSPRRASERLTPPVRHHVEVLQADAARPGWIGRVVDAHDGTVVAGARISIQRRGFERVETVASTVTSESGQFELTGVAWQDHDELVAEGTAHSELRGRVPPAGELRIALVLRRRALLERLIRWARRRGKPFDAWPEPTPDQVRRAAGEELAVARWADAVERAAYAGAPIDRDAQAQVDHLAPPDAMLPLRDEDDDPGERLSREARPARKPANAPRR